MSQLFNVRPSTGLPIRCEAGQVKDGRQYISTAGTLLDYLAMGRDPRPSTPANAEKLRRFAEADPKWMGMPMSRVLSLQTWPEGLALAERYATVMPEITVVSRKRRSVWSDDGDEFSRERFEAGQELCWSARRRQPTPKRPTVLRITCEIGGSAMLTAAQLAWSGCAAFAVADAAEQAGFRCQIDAVYWAEWSGAPTGWMIFNTIRVKEPDEPLDREAAITPMACPAFFRYYIHGAMCHASPDVTCGFGMSFPKPAPEDLQGDLHIPRCTSSDAALVAMRSLLKRLENPEAEAA